MSNMMINVVKDITRLQSSVDTLISDDNCAIGKINNLNNNYAELVDRVDGLTGGFWGIWFAYMCYGIAFIMLAKAEEEQDNEIDKLRKDINLAYKEIDELRAKIKANN